MKLPTKDASSFIFSDLLDDASSVPATLCNMSVKRENNFSPFIPKINSNYQFEYNSGLVSLFVYLKTGTGHVPWIYGPQGAGKTSVVDQLAAWFNKELRQIYASDTMEAEDLLYGYMPSEDGGMKVRLFALANAMQNGSWVLINEFDQLPASQQKALNQVLEERVVELPNGRKIIAHKDFRIIVTANTNGTGDHTGNFSQTMSSDTSVPDRFFFVKQGYLDEKKETKLLVSKALEQFKKLLSSPPNEESVELIEQLAEHNLVYPLVKYANHIRESYFECMEGSGIGVNFTISHRSTIEIIEKSIVQLVLNGLDQSKTVDILKDSVNIVTFLGLTPENKMKAEEIFNDCVIETSF